MDIDNSVGIAGGGGGGVEEGLVDINVGARRLDVGCGVHNTDDML